MGVSFKVFHLDRYDVEVAKSSRSWWLSALAFVAVIGVSAAVVTVAARRHHQVSADEVDCARAKCVAFTFDDGPTPFTDRLLRVLADNDAKATFFLIGNKVALDPGAAERISDAGMEVGNHTWEHPNMSTIPPEDIPSQLSKANDAIAAATGRTPNLYRPAGGLSTDAVRAEAAKLGMAEILWDVIPFDWINDANTAATLYMLKTQIKPARWCCCTTPTPAPLIWSISSCRCSRLTTTTWSPSAICSARANPAAATAAGSTAHRSTASPTSPPRASPACRPHTVAETGTQPVHHRHPQPEPRRAAVTGQGKWPISLDCAKLPTRSPPSCRPPSIRLATPWGTTGRVRPRLSRLAYGVGA